MKKIFLYISFLFIATSTFAQVKVGSEGNIIATGNYPVAKSSDIKGGIHFFQTIVDRNSLPANFRDTGMIAYVNENNTYYALIGGIANSNWQTWNTGVTIQDGLISGGVVTWSQQGLKFYVSPAVYVIGGKFYNSPLDSVTLDPASAQSRVDLFIVDTTSRAGKITGIADGNLLTPQADPLSQWALTQGIQINPGDTIPSSVTTKIIYDENLGIPNEWSTHTQGTISSDFNDITKPQHGLKAIYTGSYTNNSRFFFIAPSYDVITSDEVLSAWIYLTVPFTNNLYVYLYDNGTKAYSSILLSPSNGFNPNLIGQYQLISIPIYSRYWSSNYSGKWDELEFIFTGTGSGGLHVDNISLQKGINNIPPQSGTDLSAYHTATQLSDTSYSLNRPNNTKTVFILEGDTTGSGGGGTGSGVQSVVAGDNITVDNTDPSNPIVNAVLNTVTASNGLTKVGDDIQLGGTLTKETILTQAGNIFTFNDNGNDRTFIDGGNLDLLTNSGNNAITAIVKNGYALAGLFESMNDGNSFSTSTTVASFSRRKTTDTAHVGDIANVGLALYSSSFGVGAVGGIEWLYDSVNNVNNTFSGEVRLKANHNDNGSSYIGIKGNGAVRFDKYGQNLFTGTLAKSLGVDASGNVIEYDAGSGGGETTHANNGLILSGDTVQLGGVLTKNTNIYSPSYNFKLNGTTDSVNNYFNLSFSASQGLTAIFQTSKNKSYLVSVPTTSLISSRTTLGKSADLVTKADYFDADSVQAYMSASNGGVKSLVNVFPSYAHIETDSLLSIIINKTRTPVAGVATAINILRNNGGSAGYDGIGLSLDFETVNNAPIAVFPNRIISKLSNATNGSETSIFQITGIGSGIYKDLLYLSGTGLLTLVQGAPEYTDNAAAVAAGLVVGAVYRTGDTLKIVH